MERAMGKSSVLLILSTFCCVVQGFSTYLGLIPNGGRVPCTEGMEGCTIGSTCQGVGHATCMGGSMPLNPFGIDFDEGGYSWTKELCEKDSDNDGYTNGQELGDPCCTWTSFPTVELDAGFVPSHPGYAFSIPYVNATCT